MNVYDTANRLAYEIKESEEYKTYKRIKDIVMSDPDKKKKISEFEQLRYEVQLNQYTGEQKDEEKAQKLAKMYEELISDSQIKEFFDLEVKFNVMITDIKRLLLKLLEMCFSEDDKMEYIVIIIIAIITVLLLKIGLNVRLRDLKKVKELGYDENLKKIADKFPENIEICREVLKKLNNETVAVEENKESKASLYIAVTNKIIIANIKDTFTRIQTIAHECLHSVQSRRILLFNLHFQIFFCYILL